MSTKKKPNLTTEQTNQAIGMLLDSSVVEDGHRVLAPGARKKVQNEKERLEKHGDLSRCMKVSDEAIQLAQRFLNI